MPDAQAAAVVYPIFESATFEQQETGVTKGHSYSRGSNPTVDALENAIGALEGTPQAVCFRTGMAAITTLFLSTVKSGDHVIVSDVVYGGTMRLFREVLNGLGIANSSVDTSDLEAVKRAITPQTKIILIETPGNPTMKLADIEGIAAIAKQHGLLLAVDNTFLTPVLQRPFELGADISVLSTTKYIEGHHSTVGGSLACNDEKLLDRFRLVRKTVGSIQAPARCVADATRSEDVTPPNEGAFGHCGHHCGVAGGAAHCGYGVLPRIGLVPPEGVGRAAAGHIRRNVEL